MGKDENRNITENSILNNLWWCYLLFPSSCFLCRQLQQMRNPCNNTRNHSHFTSQTEYAGNIGIGNVQSWNWCIAFLFNTLHCSLICTSIAIATKYVFHLKIFLTIHHYIFLISSCFSFPGRIMTGINLTMWQWFCIMSMADSRLNIKSQPHTRTMILCDLSKCNFTLIWDQNIWEEAFSSLKPVFLLLYNL